MHQSVVVLEGDAQLPEGAVVDVTLVESTEQPRAGDPVYGLAELAVSTGIPELAAQIDHYLYGHPRG